uniref:glutamate-rich protein 3 isoform X2 n=1 Tax=Scatophagus argus TaxID=75038 RepID=UPI001ED81FAD|nr:glutamate-rich protein 3 isoform X2 [Scatophagus argus]
MSHLNPGLISAYNSLTDKHLTGYFSNTRIRRHLQRAGLITRSGRIVPDKEYRHKLIQRTHQQHVRECLAQAIFHKRVHRIEIKRRLEEFARREKVHKIKVERSKRYEEDIINIMSPRPPTGARGIRKQHSGPEGEHSESSESLSSSRPNTAPGKMQRPVRLKPIHGNSTTASLRRSSPYRLLESSNENEQPFNCTVDSRRRLTRMEASRGISPYCLPVINNFVTPVPPATKRKERGIKVTPSCTLRGRRLRPTTSSSGADVNEDPPMLRSSVHQSRVSVNMVYYGKTVHLSHDLTNMRDEVKVFQQHCGGENLCVYKGMLHEGETFRFVSRRHRGFPFSLTFFLNGLQVERLSSCCEFKHRKGSRLGGRHGHFGFSSVEGASPCYKCIIAMGLDKKPTPPPKRVTEDGEREKSINSPKEVPEMKTERTRKDDASHSHCDTSQPHDVEIQVEEETAAAENKVRDDYEEDFEADDEGPVEDAEAKDQKSPSPSSETQRQVKEADASETEDDQKDDDIGSRSASSSSDSDREESDAEADKDCREDEKAEQPRELNQGESAAPPDEMYEPNPEQAAATEAESAVTKDSDIQNSAGESTEIDISDTSVPLENENKQSDDTSGDKEVERPVDESKQEQEQERAKSVQEKLAEAILKESQCSSEPELSDTSTEEEEEEEESADKGSEQDNTDAVPEKSVTSTEQQQTLIENTKCEEGIVGEAEVVIQDEEETSDPKEHEDETEQEPHQNSDATKDEWVEDEKAASEEKTAENNKSEDTEDTSLHPVSNEEMDDKSSEPQEGAAAESTDTADKDEENKEKTAVEADTQPDETGQGAKSGEEDESLESKMNKKTDETAVPDNAEAEVMTVSETMEMKAEPSEEQEALSCEEAPVPDSQKRQQGDSEDGAAASETEVSAENSSSSLKGSGDTAVENTAEDIAKDEINKDDIKEERAEEVSEVDTKKENQQKKCDLGQEQTEKCVVMNVKLEEKSKEEGVEEERQTNPDEITETDNSEGSKADDKDQTEGEENNESKTEEKVENEEENVSELTKSESNTEGKAEKTQSEEEKVAVEDDSEKTEKDEDGECVKNENGVNESEEKGAASDKTEGKTTSETNTAADEEKADEAEKDESKAEQGEAAENKDDEESEERKVEAEEGEEISKNPGEPEKSADAVSDEDNVKISDETVAESEDVVDSEAANATHETITAEEMEEAEDVKKDNERGSNKNSENGEINAENGEISSRAENQSHEDEEGETQTEGKNSVKTAEHTEDEIKTTENESTEVKEVAVESGGDDEKLEDDKTDQAADTDVVDGEAKEDEDEEKQDESTKNNSEPETSGMETKEESQSDDRKDSEETKQAENGNISDHENRDSYWIKKNDDLQSNVSEVNMASSHDQEQSSVPTAVDLDDTAHKLDESTEPSKTDKQPHSEENADAADVSAAEGENGDTEEASKASEEGASVLLKPQAQSPPLAQNNEAENTEESAAVGKETPEALGREDNIDLVSNWVTMHQASKFFETFVEPLEDLKESSFTQSTELPRSASPVKLMKMSEDAEREQTAKDVSESMDKTREKEKEEAKEPELESNHSEGGEPSEKDPVKDVLQVQEEVEVKHFKPEAESEQNENESAKGQDVRSEERRGSRGSLEEDQVQEGLMQDNTEQTGISKTEVESIAGTHHSVTSGRPESNSENQTEDKTTDNGPDVDEKQTTVEEMKDLLPSSETEIPREHSIPEGRFELKANDEKDTEDMWEKSREVTQVTDFTEDGSQEESHHKDSQPTLSDMSISGDRRDVQLIQDIQHTLSKDRLSAFSVDETLFGRSSYPLLTAARTESGH